MSQYPTTHQANLNSFLERGANLNPDPQAVHTLPLNAAVDVVVQAVLNEEAESVTNKTVELLVAHKANPTVKDRSGKSAEELSTNYNSVAKHYFGESLKAWY